MTLAADDYALVTTPDGATSFANVHSIVSVQGHMYTFVTLYPRDVMQRDAFGANYVTTATLAASRSMRLCMAMRDLNVAPMWLYRDVHGMMRFIPKW